MLSVQQTFKHQKCKYHLETTRLNSVTNCENNTNIISNTLTLKRNAYELFLIPDSITYYTSWYHASEYIGTLSDSNGHWSWLGCFVIRLKQPWWKITIITNKKQLRLMCSVHSTTQFEERRASLHALIKYTETRLLECFWWDRSGLLQQCILGSHSPQYLTLQDLSECDTCKQSHLRNVAGQLSHCIHPTQVRNCEIAVRFLWVCNSHS